MAFDEVRFPEQISLGATGGPGFSTIVVATAGGRERRQANWAQPLCRYNIGSAVKAHWAEILAFYRARGGQARGFRFKDWSDFTSAADGVSAPAPTDQIIGTGNGVQTVFQLVKRYTSGPVTQVRPITKPVAGTVTVRVNGSPASPTVNTTTGTLTFTAPVPNGHVITAGFAFDVPVRFATDLAQLTMLFSFLAEWPDIVLTEVRT